MGIIPFKKKGSNNNDLLNAYLRYYDEYLVELNDLKNRSKIHGESFADLEKGYEASRVLLMKVQEIIKTSASEVLKRDLIEFKSHYGRKMEFEHISKNLDDIDSIISQLKALNNFILSDSTEKKAAWNPFLNLSVIKYRKLYKNLLLVLSRNDWKRKTTWKSGF